MWQPEDSGVRPLNLLNACIGIGGLRLLFQAMVHGGNETNPRRALASVDVCVDIARSFEMDGCLFSLACWKQISIACGQSSNVSPCTSAAGVVGVFPSSHFRIRTVLLADPLVHRYSAIIPFGHIRLRAATVPPTKTPPQATHPGQSSAQSHASNGLQSQRTWLCTQVAPIAIRTKICRLWNCL